MSGRDSPPSPQATGRSPDRKAAPQRLSLRQYHNEYRRRYGSGSASQHPGESGAPSSPEPTTPRTRQNARLDELEQGEIVPDDDEVPPKGQEAGATSLSFNQRVLTSKLPTGKSRETFLEFLKANIEQQSPEIKNQWNTLRLLSAFELLMRTICPFLSGSNVWTPYLVGESDLGIVRGKYSLLSDETLLGLLRSRLGHQVLAHLSTKPTDSPLIADIISLESSAICQRELPIVKLKDLSPIEEVIQRN
ncbi:hypothetical protein DVH05_007166 [Phytophthora capsici]|nr:hypothetical protein DVH05_007166 [Phytophthora capsici]